MNTQFITKLSAIACSVGLATAPNVVQAANLVSYEFDTQTTPYPATITTVGFTASAIVNAGAWGTSNTDLDDAHDVGTQTTSGFFTRASLTDSSLGDAITANDYVQFSITNGTGNTYTLDGLKFSLQGQAIGLTTFTAHTVGFVTTAAGGFTSAPTVGDEFGSDSLVTLAGTATNENEKAVTLSLNQTLNDGDTATFRVYGYETDGNNEFNQIYRMTAFTVTGAVVPEPGSLALLVAGGLLISSRRRRNA